MARAASGIDEWTKPAARARTRTRRRHHLHEVGDARNLRLRRQTAPAAALRAGRRTRRRRGPLLRRRPGHFQLAVHDRHVGAQTVGRTRRPAGQDQHRRDRHARVAGGVREDETAARRTDVRHRNLGLVRRLHRRADAIAAARDDDLERLRAERGGRGRDGPFAEKRRSLRRGDVLAGLEQAERHQGSENDSHRDTSVGAIIGGAIVRISPRRPTG